MVPAHKAVGDAAVQVRWFSGRAVLWSGLVHSSPLASCRLAQLYSLLVCVATVQPPVFRVHACLIESTHVFNRVALPDSCSIASSCLAGGDPGGGAAAGGGAVPAALRQLQSKYR